MSCKITAGLVSSLTAIRVGLLSSAALGLLSLGMMPQFAEAALVSTVSIDTTSQTFYPARNNDLIDNSQVGVSLASVAHVGYVPFRVRAQRT